MHACFECFGPLKVGYDPGLLAQVTRDDIAAGPPSMWRYAGLLPVGQDPAARVSLDPGFTPLVRADRLAAELGMRSLWVKDDSANPTHSFKDRVVSVALTAAKQLGFARVACASTGNLANSVAAHAARAGLDSIVLVPADLEPAKIVQTAVYGGTLVAVEGSYDDVNRLCSELAETDAFEQTGVRERQRPAVLRGGVEDARVRGGRAARLAAAGAGGDADGVRVAADQDRQGLRRAGLARAGERRRRGASSGRSRPAARRSPPRSRSAGTWSSRSGRPASPSR